MSSIFTNCGLAEKAIDVNKAKQTAIKFIQDFDIFTFFTPFL